MEILEQLSWFSLKQLMMGRNRTDSVVSVQGAGGPQDPEVGKQNMDAQ